MRGSLLVPLVRVVLRLSPDLVLKLALNTTWYGVLMRSSLATQDYGST